MRKRLIALLSLKSSGLTADCVLQELQALRTQENQEKRRRIQDKMQILADKTSAKEFEEFDCNPAAGTGNVLLKFYDSILDHIKQDIAKTQVSPGNIAIWYLYNMGFVIKSPTVCMGVDIHHRRAAELADKLDLLLITHNHTDHYSTPLMQELTDQGKPVVSNFFSNSFYTKSAEYTHVISGVTIHCGEADHNRKLKKFTMPMEIILPTGNKNFVFYTSGDCCDESFLKLKSEKVDLYAVHPFCIMKAVNAAERLSAQMTFIAHLHEIGHDVNRWRWSFENGRNEEQIFSQKKMSSYLPVWGEKFIWDGEKITGCQP